MIHLASYDRRRLPRGSEQPEPTTMESYGCTLSAWDVEKYLARNYPVIPGSLRFVDVASLDTKVRAAFVIAQLDGSMLRGHVLVEPNVEQDKVAIRFEIRVTGSRRYPG